MQNVHGLPAEDVTQRAAENPARRLAAEIDDLTRIGKVVTESGMLPPLSH